MWLSIAGLPAQIVPGLISALCFVSLVVLLVIALSKHRPVGKTVFSLALALFCFLLGYVIVPAQLFQAGFRQRIVATVSPDELRQIARACHEKLPVHGRLPGPQKRSLWNESEHRSQWDLLIGTTSLGKLDPWLTIFNRVDTVEIAWGGALVGHWGLIIQTNGKMKTGDVAEGIKTFISSN